MAIKKLHSFRPDYAVPPGQTLLETINHIGMSQSELSIRTGRPTKTINEITKGKAAITPETSIQLEHVLGIPASFWNSLETNYRQALATIEENKRLANQIEWLKKFPLKRMKELGYVKETGDCVELLKELYSFFGISSISSWEKIWQSPSAAFRKSPAFESSPESVSVWLRLGEIKSSRIRCEPYNSRRFRNSLKEIRSLTTKPFNDATNELISICSKAGIAVVFIPELPKTRIFGASKWLNRRKALIQLSALYKTDDKIWFSFFHEAGHILLHGKTDICINSEPNSNDSERHKEADKFASDSLMPPDKLDRFISAKQKSEQSVRRFAAELGISPSIVVGRLQHEGYLPQSHLNGLKTHLRWDIQKETQRGS
jgi:plasmid maintenance system antidote protein VapI/Zn-dependent peptidase ImmA (M78 family)